LPVTPLHFGPGLLVKALAPGRFSFTAYAATQVVIDVESGYWIWQGEWPLHRAMHTFVVGSLAGAAVGLAVAAAAPLWRRGRRGAGERRRARPHPPLGSWWAAETATVPALVGGVVGGSMHALLDGIMHPDIRPFRPFTGANPLYELIGFWALQLVCVVTGALGLVLLLRARR